MYPAVPILQRYTIYSLFLYNKIDGATATDKVPIMQTVHFKNSMYRFLMNLAIDTHEDQGRQQVLRNSGNTGLIHLESELNWFTTVQALAAMIVINVTISTVNSER